MKKKVTDKYIHNSRAILMLPVHADSQNAFHHIPVGETPNDKKFPVE